MELGILQWVGSTFGVGALFGIIMFYIYRHECKRHEAQIIKQAEQSENRVREDRRFMEDRLTNVINDYNVAVKDSTKISSELFQYLKGRNGKKN